MLNVPTWKTQVTSLSEKSLVRKQGIRFDPIHINTQKEVNFEKEKKNQEGNRLSFFKKIQKCISA